MTYDWKHKWLEFDYKGSRIRLQGVSQRLDTEIQEISGEQLLKLHKGNDVWATFILTPVQTASSLQDQNVISDIPLQIKDLIRQFDTLFQAPTELPPSRVYDHSISLLSDSVPVNSKLYRYSPDQKTEIEKQVAAILQSGTVIPSLSPFASPVLLVKKKMDHGDSVLTTESLMLQ